MGIGVRVYNLGMPLVWLFGKPSKESQEEKDMRVRTQAVDFLVSVQKVGLGVLGYWVFNQVYERSGYKTTSTVFSVCLGLSLWQISKNALPRFFISEALLGMSAFLASHASLQLKAYYHVVDKAEHPEWFLYGALHLMIVGCMINSYNKYCLNMNRSGEKRTFLYTFANSRVATFIANRALAKPLVRL